MENFGILTPGDSNFDLSQKITEMISKWFFASFRTLPFVFLYGNQEPRSWGGGGRSNAPPPAGGGKSRGPAGRGLTCLPDMLLDPTAGSMIKEDLSQKCNIGSMIWSDPIVKFASGSWDPIVSLDYFSGRILDPIGYVMKTMIADQWSQELYHTTHILSFHRLITK